jgi:hypothetical protein
MENAENTAGTPQPPEPQLAPALPAQPTMSAFARMIGIFFEPDATFQDIARSPGFIAPLLLVMLCSLGTVATMHNRLDWSEVVAKQMEKNPRFESLPKEQKEQQIKVGAKIGTYVLYATPLFVPLGVLIIAGVLIMMSNFVFGGTATFKQVFSVAIHAQLVGIIVSILAVVVLFLKDPADIDVQNLVASNLGPLISAETSKFLHATATSLDLFSFWQIFLLGTGLSICGRISRTKGIIAVVIPWLIVVLIKSGFASLGS